MSAPARAEGRRIPVMGKSAKGMGDREASHPSFFAVSRKNSASVFGFVQSKYFICSQIFMKGAMRIPVFAAKYLFMPILVGGFMVACDNDRETEPDDLLIQGDWFVSVDRKYEDALDKGNDNEKDVLIKNKELFIHHDIRPYNDLDDIKDLDKKFAQFIPWIINVTENNLNNTDMNSNDYKPEPIDTSDVVLPDSLKPLFEAMAKNVHEVWAQTRMRQGWKYGPSRDDSKKLHPMLVAYEDLPDQEKEYDRKTSIETLKLIIKLGFTISEK